MKRVIPPAVCVCATLLAAPFLLASLAVLSAAAQSPRTAARTAAPTFHRDVRPILEAQCVGCHSAANAKNPTVSGGLALDTFAAVRGRAGIVAPGKPDASELLRRLETKDPKLRMPKGGDPLPAAQIALIRRWIAAGAAEGVPPKPVAESAVAAVTATRALEVVLPTRLDAPADALTPKSPKDAKLALALSVGPLPPITAIAYSPDGKTLAVGSYRAVFLWDIGSGQVTRALTQPSGAVQALCWSADGSTLVAGGGVPGASGEILAFDAAGGYRRVLPLTGHTDVVYSVAISPNGKQLASASQDKTVRTWDLDSGKLGLTIKQHSDVVYRVRYTPDGSGLVSCGQDRSVRLWDAKTGSLTRGFEGHQSGVTALAVRPDGQRFVSADADNRLRWWNPADGATVSYGNGHTAQVNDIVFSKDGKLVASASADHTLRLWDTNGGGPQKTLSDAPDWNYCVVFSPDGKFVAAGGGDGIARLWTVADGALKASLMASASKSGEAGWAVISPQGWFAASPAWSNRVSLKAGESAVKMGQSRILPLLRNPDAALKSLHAEKVDPPNIAPPAAQKPGPSVAK